MKKILVFLCVVLLVSCSNEQDNASKENKVIETATNLEVVSDKEKEDKVTQTPVVSRSGLTCGQVYETQNMDYNIIGVRLNEYDNGQKFLIINMEVMNKEESDVSLNAFGKFELKDNQDAIYDYDMFAAVDRKFEGLVTTGNKFTGELAFDVSESEADEYHLYIGEAFEQGDLSFTITSDDIGMTYPEKFESKAIESDYTYNIPVVSEVFTVTLISSQVMVGDNSIECLLQVTNNSQEAQSFMLGLNFDAFSAGGSKLDSDRNYTLPMNFDPGQVSEGIVSFKIKENEKSFYIVVKPDLGNFQDTYTITFDVE